MKVHEFETDIESLLLKQYEFYNRYKKLDDNDQFIKLTFFSKQQKIKQAFKDLTGLTIKAIIAKGENHEL